MPLPVLAGSIDAYRLGRLGRTMKQRFGDDAGGGDLQRLFSGALVTPADAAELAGDLVEDLMAEGLVRAAGGGVRACFSAQLVESNLIFTDLWRPELQRERLFVDPLWEAPTLSRLLAKRPVARALDLGCGCGVLALTMAAYCGEVIGADINPRAVELSRFNAALNGVENVRFVQSDLFEGLPSGQFDQIVFNAPVGFEFQPVNLLATGEEILERFFSALQRQLAVDGTVQVNMCVKDWKGDPFFKRLDRWLGPQAAEFHYAFLQLYALEGGPRFLLRRLAASLADRKNYLRCERMRRGWLTMRRATNGQSFLIKGLGYEWAKQASADAAGSALACLPLASDGEPTVDGLKAGLLAHAQNLPRTLV